MSLPATIRVINGEYQHDFVFTVTRLQPEIIKVRVECPGVTHEGHPVNASSECIITPANGGLLDFEVLGATIYKAHGTVTWDTHRQVVRFFGDLTLVNVGQVRFSNSPVVDVPTE